MLDIWIVNIEGNVTGNPSRLLSRREKERAERFVDKSDQRRYVRAHAALRALASRYEKCRPDELVLDRETKGKPFFRRNNGQRTEWRFNLSHAGNRVLIAFAPKMEIGVDVEIERDLPVCDLARRFFAPTEATTLQQLAEPHRQAAFFAAWVRKEACLKASGTGLSGGLDQCRVPVTPEKNRWKTTYEGQPWWIADLHMETGCHAAVAWPASESVVLRLHPISFQTLVP